jgi:hypothetical protein
VTELNEVWYAIDDVYAQGSNGGALHIVLDDGNVEDCWLAWCGDRPMTLIERRCYELLLPMSEQERGSVTAAYHGESSW